ncbi:dna repair protein rhp42 [Stemphylium lycopersici]|nr:dna repair protein rhp42 [Stemphylium lycopersici]RAR01883.1 dna repair protein rhp42 [Stemphylium lycopersici]
MPPILSRKRLHSASPIPEPPPKRARARKPTAPARRGKESVFQTLDAPPKANRTLSQTKALLEQDEDGSDLSESESSDDEFEHVPLTGANKGKEKAKAPADEDSDESEDGDWEDALGAHHHTKTDNGPTPVITGDIALTLSAAPKTAFESKADGKKGPSKVQRQIRNVTHCMHVQYLMYHNLSRNAWIQDKEAQEILVEGISAGCWRELEKYWADAGIKDGPSRVVVQKAPNPQKEDTKASKGKWKDSGKRGIKVYESPQKRTDSRNEKKQAIKAKDKEPLKGDRRARDWGAASEPLEPNVPNLSAGDPLLRLLRYLSAYWKAKFQVTAPSLRKRGYLSPSALEAETKAWKEDPNHPDTFGERIEDVGAFRERAKECNGSRDVGQQLFTALVRGLGIEARMVASLQPVGFGWSQSEEGKPKNLEKLNDAKTAEKTSLANSTPTSGKAKSRSSAKRDATGDVDMDDSSDLSSVISISSDSEEERPAKKLPKARNYGEDMPYPTYWTEAISNLTHTPISVSPLPRTTIASATSPEKLAEFYARGAAADKARQVFAYLIAFSADGTAKDVTTRYLPKHQWPGRTKGFRMPVEKIPIHNKRGKVKRWEEWDWFKSVMRLYARPHDKRQPWDEVEDESELIPAKPEKKKGMDEEGGKETLQGYKNSTEYVLERHLRREEALKRGAKVVRHFVTGKGSNEKSEPVYRRKDVVLCKTQESWHKEGREVLEGQQPLKLVPMRAVTATRKREIEERERIEGGKVKQGLYSKEQTDWIIPDPIVDGKIPRNAFGNIDVYVPTMVPKGSVHIPLKGTARICRKLNMDYAEACTGFEFGKQRAVPVLTGVVVAEDNADKLIDAWEIEEAEKQRKEREKREKFLLGLWRKFTSGLRIVDRMRNEYGEDVELPAKEKASLPAEDEDDGEKKSQWEVFQNHADFEGGFIRDDAGASGGGGFIPEKSHQMAERDEEMADGFLPASQDEPEHGDLTIDDGERKATHVATTKPLPHEPISLTQALQQPTSEPSDHSDQVEVTSADQDTEDDEHEDEHEEENEQDQLTKPKPARGKSKAATTSTRRRGRPRGRGTKAPTPSARKRKSAVIGTSNDELSDTPSNPPSPPPSTRSAPRRKAARQSDAQVKSHFFAEQSEGETDLTDMTDRNSPRKKATRGGGVGRGRGRGRDKAGKAKS